MGLAIEWKFIDQSKEIGNPSPRLLWKSQFKDIAEEKVTELRVGAYNCVCPRWFMELQRGIYTFFIIIFQNIRNGRIILQEQAHSERVPPRINSPSCRISSCLEIPPRRNSPSWVLETFQNVCSPWFSKFDAMQNCNFVKPHPREYPLDNIVRNRYRRGEINRDGFLRALRS